MHRQPQIYKNGNSYLRHYFPKLDYVIQARVLGDDVPDAAAPPNDDGLSTGMIVLISFVTTGSVAVCLIVLVFVGVLLLLRRAAYLEQQKRGSAEGDGDAELLENEQELQQA
jgi:hypothetical protein